MPAEFPPSLESITISHNPTPRDSRSTLNFSSPIPTRLAVTPLFPSNLHFGDNLSPVKADSSFRIGFCNIGGFLATGFNNPKVSEQKHFLASYNLDLFGGCEANLNWHGLPHHLQIKEWFHSADGCCTFAAHNSHENFGTHQFGVMFWIAAGHATSHISSGCKDPSNLSCWVSCSLLSHLGKRLHIVFAY